VGAAHPQGSFALGRMGPQARALRYLDDEVVKGLNAGMWYEDILHELELPDSMKGLEALKPAYGCPTSIAHGILRRYTGWYDGNPSNLFPPEEKEIYGQIAAVAGKERLLEKAHAFREQGWPAMAVQFVDMVLALELDAEEEKALHRLKAQCPGGIGGQGDELYCARSQIAISCIPLVLWVGVRV